MKIANFYVNSQKILAATPSVHKDDLHNIAFLL